MTVSVQVPAGIRKQTPKGFTEGNAQKGLLAEVEARLTDKDGTATLREQQRRSTHLKPEGNFSGGSSVARYQDPVKAGDITRKQARRAVAVEERGHGQTHSPEGKRGTHSTTAGPFVLS